jgi:hypothetical protein
LKNKSLQKEKSILFYQVVHFLEARRENDDCYFFFGLTQNSFTDTMVYSWTFLAAGRTRSNETKTGIFITITTVTNP